MSARGTKLTLIGLLEDVCFQGKADETPRATVMTAYPNPTCAHCLVVFGAAALSSCVFTVSSPILLPIDLPTSVAKR